MIKKLKLPQFRIPKHLLDEANKITQLFLARIIGEQIDKSIKLIDLTIGDKTLKNCTYVPRSTTKGNLQYLIDVLNDGEIRIRQILEGSEKNAEGDVYIDITLSWKVHPLNLILFGPPGTGKTYTAIERAVEVIDYKEWRKADNVRTEYPKKAREIIKTSFDELRKDGRIEFITFHQSYSYEEFIEGIKPIISSTKTDADSNQIKYKIHFGVFKELAEKAKKDLDNNYVLIIDEINRGNVSQIFGELITLIEKNKRLGEDEVLELTLPYSSEAFCIPPNLYIIATMNTADKSVEALDTALRRRFYFEEISPISTLIPEIIPIEGMPKIEIRKIFETINHRLEILKDKDHQIGHEYLMNCKIENDVIEAFQYKIIPLLKEYFYSDYGKIALVLGDDFIEREKKQDSIKDNDSEDEYFYEIKNEIEIEWINKITLI